jgi:hypothetical protein
VSAARTSSRLLRLYPRAWRQRYGEELEGLIVEVSGGGRVPWRTRLDIALAGGRERLRAAGLGPERPADERIKASLLAVLCAWALFVVGGLIVQKFSEHWQSATPPGDRPLPSAAFAVLVIAAACGTAMVLAGSAATVPSLVAFLRAGGWPAVRRRCRDAVLTTVLSLAAGAGLVAWASTLDPAQREGGNVTYGIAAVATGLLACACLAAWTAAAVAIGCRLRLPARALRLQSLLSAGVVATMAAISAATIVWWASLAGSPESFLSGSSPAAADSTVPAQLALAAAIMVVATLTAAMGAHRALRSLPALPRSSQG